MKAGNHFYAIEDMPTQIPVFPLAGALLLPRGQLPLNIFEPRYLTMIDKAIAGNRMIGMIQPIPEASGQGEGESLCAIGCAGRITAFAETGDDRYAVTLTGIARFRTRAEVEGGGPFRRFEVDWRPFIADFFDQVGEGGVDRNGLLSTFRSFLKANDLDADWDAVNGMTTEVLVNALSMMSPYGPAEKQALLEAPDLKTRAATLVAITEMSLARSSGESMPLQ